MPTIDIESLRVSLDQAAVGLKKVAWRRMFGCDAVFADGTIFGLIWKEGRIGLKLPDAAEFEDAIRVRTTLSEGMGSGRGG